MIDQQRADFSAAQNFPLDTMSALDALWGELPLAGYFDRDRFSDMATVFSVFDRSAGGGTNGEKVVWCVRRSSVTNESYRGQSYQPDTGRWRVVW